MNFQNDHLSRLLVIFSIAFVITTASEATAGHKHRNLLIGQHCGVSWGLAVGSCPSGVPFDQPQHHLYQQPLGPVNTFLPAPPPGTLGRTFQLRSRPVPIEKHPRVGMVDMHIENAHEVILHDVNQISVEQIIEGFRDVYDDNLWHFESQPLYPGLEHIYRVQAIFRNPNGTMRTESSYIRLVMGRVIELKF